MLRSARHPPDRPRSHCELSEYSDLNVYVKYDVFKSKVATLTTRIKHMAESLEERFGKRCKKLRHQAGLSQLDMVRDHGFSLSHYQKIERGTLDPRLSTLIRIAKSFGISVSELVNSL